MKIIIVLHAAGGDADLLRHLHYSLLYHTLLNVGSRRPAHDSSRKQYRYNYDQKDSESETLKIF